MDIARVSVTLPTPPAQLITHTHRVVTVKGSLDDGTQDIQVGSNGPIVFDADVQANVTVWVQEVLANGRLSAPCEIVFCPHKHVKARCARHEEYLVEVLDVIPSQQDSSGATVLENTALQNSAGEVLNPVDPTASPSTAPAVNTPVSAPVAASQGEASTDTPVSAETPPAVPEVASGGQGSPSQTAQAAGDGSTAAASGVVSQRTPHPRTPANI